MISVPTERVARLARLSKQCYSDASLQFVARGFCAWLVAQAASIASAGPADLTWANRSPVEATRPRLVRSGESAEVAFALLSAGDVSAAREVILASIAASQQDAGQRWSKYVPAAGRSIAASPELGAALKAMPQLGDLVRRRPDIHEWLSFAFTGFGTEPVVWEDAPPRSGAEASSDRNSAGKRCVQVRRTATVGARPEVSKHGEVLLSQLVFELFNVQNIDAFHELNERVRLGKISRDAYIKEYVKLEADAAELTRAFFANVLIAGANRSELPAQEQAAAWWLFADDKYWSDLCDPRKGDANSYPWFPYGTNYDLMTAHEFALQQQYAAAIRALSPVWPVKSLDPTEKANVHQLAAYCHLQLGEFGPALEHASDSIRLSPSADAFERRAQILGLIGRQQEAADDRRQAEIARLRELLVP